MEPCSNNLAGNQPENSQIDSYSVEITLNTRGVRSLRVLGKDWDGSGDIHAFLQHLSPFIQKLDAAAKIAGRSLHFDDAGVLQ